MSKIPIDVDKMLDELNADGSRPVTSTRATRPRAWPVKRLHHFIIPLGCSILATSAMATRHMTMLASDQSGIDAARGLWVDMTTLVGIIIGIGTFIVWAVTMYQRSAATMKELKKDGNATLELIRNNQTAIRSAQALADKRTVTVIRRIDHERERRKAMEQVVRSMAEHMEIDKSLTCKLASPGDSLAGQDGLDDDDLTLLGVDNRK